MGLDIETNSELHYHRSYSALHTIRWMAYRQCGGEKDFADLMGMVNPYKGRPSSDKAWDIASRKFKNLILHSDCEGSYTRKGKVNIKTGMTGNSIELLKELELLEKNIFIFTGHEHIENSFGLLLRVVKQIVENEDGRIKFT